MCVEHLEEKQLASLRLLMLLGAQFAVATVAAVLTLPTDALFPLRICDCTIPESRLH